MDVLKIKVLRKKVGLTQARLAELASVSLPFVQRIEAGRANPSVAVLTSLLEPLGYQLTVTPVEVSDAQLAGVGIPLAAETENAPPQQLATQDLVATAHQLAQSLSRNPDPRTEEAFAAWLLALERDYPTFFKKHFAAGLSNFVPKEPTGRHIKLRRIARERLARVL